jgi:hypothetical protein
MQTSSELMLHIGKSLNLNDLEQTTTEAGGRPGSSQIERVLADNSRLRKRVEFLESELENAR